MGFYQSSSISPSRATVQMSEALTLDPLEQLRDPLPKSMRGTEGSSICEMLCSDHRKGIKEGWEEASSLLSCTESRDNLLLCTFHSDSREPHHHCQCRVRKQPTAMPPAHLPFLSDFASSLGSRHVWPPFLPDHFKNRLYQFQAAQLLIFRTQLRLLEGQPSLLIRFLASRLHWWVALSSWDSVT